MPYQASFVLRHRDGEVRAGPAYLYQKGLGWRDIAGVPASKKYGSQWFYNPARAERHALRSLVNIVGVDDDEKTRKQNADLFWAALDFQYNDLEVHPTYRKQRPVEKQAA